MAIPAHKTEYFIIENSNLQKKANTARLRDRGVEVRVIALFYAMEKRFDVVVLMN